MTPQEIEDLQAGPQADALIESEFFGFRLEPTIHDPIVDDPDKSNPMLRYRDPRPFSTLPRGAIEILESLPHWETWRDTGGIHVRLHKAADETTWLHATATDQSFCLAICKAALYLVEVIREWRNQHAKEKPEQAAWTSREEKTSNTVRDRPISGSGEADPT